ncbi:hypothetical protein JTB14_013081 [Gonioctena quinquepunctata]|nr:hypothetical protein JTB14_013081 [Gonioctena quinquepunctata]
MDKHDLVEENKYIPEVLEAPEPNITNNEDDDNEFEVQVERLEKEDVTNKKTIKHLFLVIYAGENTNSREGFCSTKDINVEGNHSSVVPWALVSEASRYINVNHAKNHISF